MAGRLAVQLDRRPATAFSDGPGARVGAILNQSAAATHDGLLTALDEEDTDFAALVRQSIFTFAHIPARTLPRDVIAILRGLDQADLVTALAGATAENDKASVEFLLSNMSTRMADNLREEITERGKVKLAEAEEAMTLVIGSIRTLVDEGAIALIEEDSEE